MAKTFKLDLHTHPIEALKEKLSIKGVGDINKTVAETIVKAVKSAGLNGIAITERDNFNHGWVAALEIFDHFQKENLVILPGAEVGYGDQHYLEIYIPDYYRRRIPFFQGKEWFIILAHPGYYKPIDIDQLSKVKFDAIESCSLYGDFSIAEQINLQRKTTTLQVSDAHKLEDLGRCYTEVEFK